ncbi:MAG: GNAT family N-acetyltransferase [Clostridia bacterium]|nr:GNAT family N-acetyltransferase [Clostridia bacterium]
MEILEFGQLNKVNQDFWLEQIKSCDWWQGQELYKHLKNDTLFQARGENSVYLLTEGENLLAFLMLADISNVQPTNLTKWIGYVYTYPEYRGQKLINILIQKAKEDAKAQGYNNLYVSTEIVGLYEKFGFEFLKDAGTIYNTPTKIYKAKI